MAHAGGEDLYNSVIVQEEGVLLFVSSSILNQFCSVYLCGDTAEHVSKSVRLWIQGVEWAQKEWMDQTHRRHASVGVQGREDGGTEGRGCSRKE